MYGKSLLSVFLLLQMFVSAQCCKKKVADINLKEIYKTTFHGGHRYSGYSTTYHFLFEVKKQTIIHSFEFDSVSLVINTTLAKPSNIPTEMILTVNYQPENPISGSEGGTEYTLQVLVKGELHLLSHEIKKRLVQTESEMVIQIKSGKKKRSIIVDKVPLKEAIQAP